MTYDTPYDNTNKGLLKRNDNRKKDTHPEYNGSINVDGVDYWLAGWVKVGREGTKLAGQKFFSLELTPKEEQQSQPAPRAQAPAPARARAPAPAQKPAGGFYEMDDDIPF